jgi:hypothetical protein
MEDGRIPDNAITASSYAALPGYRASRSRLNTVSIGGAGYGAWVAAKNDGKQWLRVTSIIKQLLYYYELKTHIYTLKLILWLPLA